MCARTVIDGVQHKPGDKIPVKSGSKVGKAKWVGFARSETAQVVWKRFDVPLDVPAEKFAERNRKTQGLTYARVLEGSVIYGVGNRKTGEMRVLTREADNDEREIFGHHRLPCIGRKRF